jgi:dipeptidyl aminopeptidase/acylaminoacyl peptidase
VTALRLSPDGTWLAAAVQTLAADGKKHVTSIWRIPAVPADGEDPRRLTRSAEGEGNPRFRPDGSVLFTSKRNGYDAGQPAGGNERPGADEAALWMLPASGGEAILVAAMPGGVTAVEAAAGSGAVVLASPVMPGADGRNGSTADDDARLRQARRDAGVTAILHESVPVRYWDHDLGPAQPRLFTVADPAPEPAGGPAALRDLTPAPGRALDRQPFGVSPDGATIATGWWRWEDAGDSRAELAVIDVATGTRRSLLSAPGFDYENPALSPDGRQVACIRSAHHAPEHPGDVTIVLAPVAGPTGAAGSDGPAQPGDPAQPGEPGGGRDLLAGFDRHPAAVAWAPDSASVYFTADDQGRRPVFRAEVATGEIVRITADDGAYSDLCPAPDGRYLFALRSSVDEPPTPVRLEAAEGSKPLRLASPGSPVAVPGHLEEIETAADDGTPIRSWLVMPETASAQAPAPLLLWVHGGPMMSWNSWSWRWNPWLMAARGYAVLLPDPALSTGYGHDFIARAYHQWGARPFADLMAATDAAMARPDIDGSRTAMMGGSYGGYMANWIAGHTDRFKAIVSHASLWVLDQMFGTTDLPMFWRPQFGDPLTSPERYEANSPHRHIASIRTPMLVIHGNKDYRVPVGEALRLWWDLTRHGAEAKFLYFPDENHWILSPGHASVWYETVFAFLAHHVLGEPWRRPGLL